MTQTIEDLLSCERTEPTVGFEFNLRDDVERVRRFGETRLIWWSESLIKGTNPEAKTVLNE